MTTEGNPPKWAPVDYPGDPEPKWDPPRASTAHKCTNATESAESTERMRSPRTEYLCHLRSLCSLCRTSGEGEDHRVCNAVALTMPEEGAGNHSVTSKIFEFQRNLKAIPELADFPATDEILAPIIELWHQAAVTRVPQLDLNDVQSWFYDGWPKVKFKAGTGPLHEAFERGRKSQPPPEAIRYKAHPIRWLVSLCRELQEIDKDKPFRLACRPVAGLLGVDHATAARYLRLLCHHRVISLAKDDKGNDRKGVNGRATEYWYPARAERVLPDGEVVSEGMDVDVPF